MGRPQWRSADPGSSGSDCGGGGGGAARRQSITGSAHASSKQASLVNVMHLLSVREAPRLLACPAGPLHAGSAAPCNAAGHSAPARQLLAPSTHTHTWPRPPTPSPLTLRFHRDAPSRSCPRNRLPSTSLPYSTSRGGPSRRCRSRQYSRCAGRGGDTLRDAQWARLRQLCVSHAAAASGHPLPAGAWDSARVPPRQPCGGDA